MNYEKRYKEMLAKARAFYKKWDGVDAYNSSLAISELKEIFPELNKNEDEKIRETLIDYLKERKSCESYGQYVLRYDRWINLLEKQDESDETKAKEFLINKGYPIDTNDVLPTYEEMYNIIRDGLIIREGLEKQREQNNADKVEPKDNNSIEPHFGKSNNKFEPKFHGGDFIKHNVINIIYKVITVNSNSYYAESIKTGCRVEFFSAEQNFHLWTIEDAEEGDILYSPKHDLLWIYKNKDEYHVASNGNFISVESLIEISSDVCPATKEQRDFLFQKMKVYGYEWHADKKEVIRLDVTEW